MRIYKPRKLFSHWTFCTILRIYNRKSRKFYLTSIWNPIKNILLTRNLNRKRQKISTRLDTRNQRKIIHNLIYLWKNIPQSYLWYKFYLLWRKTNICIGSFTFKYIVFLLKKKTKKHSTFLKKDCVNSNSTGYSQITTSNDEN